jgi:S-DNA-T family DNA segregation ATPase FtsK/SpoIIIE
MELSIGREFFGERYAAEPVAMVELLEAAHEAMHARADELAGVARRFEPSERHPLHVLVVDELGYLTALLPDRKLRARAEDALQGILTLGRSVGFTVVGALQDPRKETLGYRDLFPTRVAMRLQKPMVDLVLGAGMYEAGAQCDLIPPRQAGAGVAFVKDEASTLPLCVRLSWCSDDLIRATAARLLSAGGSDVPQLRAIT